MDGNCAGRTPLLDIAGTPDLLRRLDDRQLAGLAGELRDETIRAVSRTGGHLGSGLGVVELTVAIHAVFDTPRDKLIWDVGHQCYPHKILTGRRDQMAGLRREGGISGFTRRAESEYDPFGAAHSSTSISAGLGFAAARQWGCDVGDVICVIGDGAMSAGMAFEALNNAVSVGQRILVILNDNDMSIAPSVGALSAHLGVLRGRVGEAGDPMASNAPSLFENLGLAYEGPVDGHCMDDLLAALRRFRDDAQGPVLLHVRTRKGAGYEPAERSADKYHGVSPYDPQTGVQVKAVASAPAYTRVFADALIAEAQADPRVVAITAAMPSGTGVDLFARRFPDRSFDTGIAEQHAVTFAAGMAAAGMKPFCAIYSTFLQRGYDQIVHDVSLQNLPVRFAIDRAGLVGADGPTHAGSYDIAFLSSLPGFTVMAAADEVELCHMVATAAAHDSGPIAFRYPRGEGRGLPLPERGTPLPIGKGRIIRKGRTVALLSLGSRLGECELAAEALVKLGLSTTVADARFARPLDTELIAELVARHALLVTIEEGARGGFGSMVLHHMADAGWLDGRIAIRTLCLPDRPIAQASPDAMYRDAGLSADNIVATALEALGIAPSARKAGENRVSGPEFGVIRQG